MTTKARATTTEGQPVDVLARGDALQARRQAEALEPALAVQAEPMAAFDVLEAEVWPRVAPLAADFVRWKLDYGRAWVRAEPGLENERMWLDGCLEAAVHLAEFPDLVARARALYAALTVENAAYAERTIRELLRSAQGVESVAAKHRDAQAHVQTIQKTLDRRIAAGTLRPPASQGLAPATSEAAPRAPRRAASGLSGDAA
jgi:hypothetical protein